MNLKTMCYLLGVAILSAVLTMMPVGLLKTFADGNMSKTEVNVESTAKTNISVDNHQESSLTQVEPKGLLYKEYKVIV